MNRAFKTARNAGLISCHSCHLLCQSAKQPSHMRCPRCGASLHDRKPNSIARTWALVLAAYNTGGGRIERRVDHASRLVPEAPLEDLLNAAGDTVIDSALTDTNGDYELTGIQPGVDYLVCEGSETDWFQSYPVSGSGDCSIVEEAGLGIDAAMKAASVRAAKLFPPPTETNYSAAWLTGEQHTCWGATLEEQPDGTVERLLWPMHTDCGCGWSRPDCPAGPVRSGSE